MHCLVGFIIYLNDLNDDEMYDIIDTLNIEAGITDEALYFCLSKKDTNEDFLLSQFIHESLGSIFKKKDLLIELANKYQISYELMIKFSDIEAEIERNQSFIVDDETKEFINSTNTYFNLNNGYFEE